MAHATFWYAQATGDAPSPRCSAVGVGPESLGRGAAERSRREFGVSLAANVSTQGDPGPGGETDPGTSSTVVGGRETATGEAADLWRSASGVPNRAVDAAARGRTDPPEVRRALSSRPRLEGPDRLGLELPEARAARRRARRGRDRALDPRRMVAHKKTPRDVAPISCSSMRAGSCSSQMFGALGRRRGRPHVSGTGIATIGCRSAAGWPSRQSIGGWRSTSGVVRITSPVSTSRPFSVTSCVICADRSTCSGIAVQFIAGEKSVHSSRLILDSSPTTSLRTHLNSIRPSTCGPRLIMNSPTAHPMISANSAPDSPMRRADYAAPSISCGHAFTRPRSHGPDKTFHYLRRTQ